MWRWSDFLLTILLSSALTEEINGSGHYVQMEVMRKDWIDERSFWVSQVDVELPMDLQYLKPALFVMVSRVLLWAWLKVNLWWSHPDNKVGYIFYHVVTFWLTDLYHILALRFLVGYNNERGKILACPHQVSSLVLKASKELSENQWVTLCSIQRCVNTPLNICLFKVLVIECIQK